MKVARLLKLADASFQAMLRERQGKALRRLYLFSPELNELQIPLFKSVKNASQVLELASPMPEIRRRPMKQTKGLGFRI